MDDTSIFIQVEVGFQIIFSSSKNGRIRPITEDFFPIIFVI